MHHRALGQAQVSCADEVRSERGVPAHGDLAGRSEETERHDPVVRLSKDERRLREIHLPRDRLHRAIAETLGIKHDGRGVARQTAFS
jgi:hypothetical protein